MKLLETCRGFK